MKTESLLEVKEYYGNKYKPILKSFENKKVKLYQIDESCGKYLELSVLMENGNKIFVNHGISNSKPYTESISSIKVPSTSTPLSFISSFTILSDNSYPDGDFVSLI